MMFWSCFPSQEEPVPGTLNAWLLAERCRAVVLPGGATGGCRPMAKAAAGGTMLYSVGCRVRTSRAGSYSFSGSRSRMLW